MTSSSVPSPRGRLERWLVWPAYLVSCYLIATPFLLAALISLVLCLVTLVPLLVFWHFAKISGLSDRGPADAFSSV